VWEDLYLVMPGYDVAAQSGTFQVVINPLVNWIWVGFGVLAVGTMIALLPESALAFAAAHVPAGAATTVPLILLLLLGPAATASAQHVESANPGTVVARTPLEKDLFKSIICMCGTCGRQLVGECTCGTAASMREEISGLVKRGMTRDQVVEYYMAKYGSQEPLAEPLDRGFNRLAWLLPYVVGIAGALTVGIVSTRWARRSGPAAAAASGDSAPIPADMAARLDDELRDLD
jgi:cytochrome c-type biogenesis protein CcmF